MNTQQLINFILSTEVDVSASFLYRIVEDYGMDALVEWFMNQTNNGGALYA